MLLLRRLESSRCRQSHQTRVLQAGHDYSRDGEHEAAHDWLGVVIEFGVGETDAGAEEGDPGAPHLGTHGEHHAQDAHIQCDQMI